MYQYQLGQVVLVKGEKIIGVVSYLGNVHWDSDHNKKYVGLTLSDPVENGHNGSLKGKKYFECNDKHGLIIPSQHISRRIEPPELLQKVTTLNNAFKECYNQSQQMKQKYLQIRQTLSRVNLNKYLFLSYSIHVSVHHIYRQSHKNNNNANVPLITLHTNIIYVQYIHI